MSRCPACSQAVPEGSRFCLSCATPLTSSETPTRIGHSVSDPPGGARFVPGTLVAGRYRMVGLLGRGGMGEVYRADDLKLGQAVALKFLPIGLERDGDRLSRLLSEVRIARQISHTNVCRVYDVGEADGQHFISMEYVDGEDLATLLRRIGRLPRDKAVQVARQLCAGLAAAHEQGVLHRDLKPANIMIDGRGRARITDFGLAALAVTAAGREAKGGTPGYMAPEQLAGREVTVRSDIYSLGLVLYELFTGKPAFRAGSAAELARLHEQSTPTQPSSLVEGFDPAVERVILRCLERDPRHRPASALAVAAGLPGGDPLAAALAAGETPSPEMVADAGDVGGLRPGIAIAWLAAVTVGLLGVAILAPMVGLLGRADAGKAPEVLTDRAREICSRLGYSEAPADEAWDISTNEDYVRYLIESHASEAQWARLRTDRPTIFDFWYRRSPRLLVPASRLEWTVSRNDPALTVSRMARLTVDAAGRLQSFEAVPPQKDETDAAADTAAWSGLFAEAGLDMADFTPVRPVWLPAEFADSRAAWEGTYPDQPEPRIRVEAAAYRGRPVSFQIVWPWTRPWREQEDRPETRRRVAAILGSLLGLVVITGTAFMARRNVRLGRGDRRGGTRLAIFMGGTVLLQWVLNASHVPDFTSEFDLFFNGFVGFVFITSLYWLFYVAFEPYARRLWPQVLISWSRLLAGRLRDPMIGRDVLIGAAFGVLVELILQVHTFVPGWMGGPPHYPFPVLLSAFVSTGGFGDAVLRVLLVAVTFSVFLPMQLLLARVALRRQWLAIGAVTLFSILVSGLDADHLGVDIVIATVFIAIRLFLLFRFGLLAVISCNFFYWICHDLVLGLAPSTWFGRGTLVVMLGLLALATAGFFICLAGRPLFQDRLLTEVEQA